MTTQKLWDAAKAVLRGKFIAIQSHLKKQEKHQIDNLTLHLKQLKKEEEKNPKISRRKEIIKIWTEINEKEIKETTVKINKTKSWFFEKINKTDKPLARLIKKKREKNQINKIRNEKGEDTTDNAEIQRIMRLLRTTIWQLNGYPGGNGQILRKVQTSKTEPGINRSYEQPNYKHWN